VPNIYCTRFVENGVLGYEIRVFLIDILGGGAQLGPLGTAATNRPIVPAPDGYDGGEIDVVIGKGN
jgi:hypothetical protein